MKYLVSIFLIGLLSCSYEGQKEKESESYSICFDGFNVNKEWGDFVLDSIPLLESEVLIANNYVDDSSLVGVIASCLNDKTDNYGNYLRYYSVERSPAGDWLTFIRVDDYSYKMYLMSVDMNSCSPFYCIEVASSGGDGGDGYSSYSYVQHDTLEKVEIRFAAVIDEATDMFTDKIYIDTIRSVSILSESNASLIKSDTISSLSRF